MIITEEMLDEAHFAVHKLHHPNTAFKTLQEVLSNIGAKRSSFENYRLELKAVIAAIAPFIRKTRKGERKKGFTQLDQATIKEIKDAFFLENGVLLSKYPTYDLIKKQTVVCGRFVSKARIKFILENGYSPEGRSKLFNHTRSLPLYIYQKTGKRGGSFYCLIKANGNAKASKSFKTLEQAINYLPILKKDMGYEQN